MSHELRGSSAVVGVGLAGCGEAHGRMPLDILAEATHNALDDAGLKLSDVDGIFTGSSYHFMPEIGRASCRERV